uniref:Nucleoside-diphosphate kinase n=1 Tax=Pygocentrus nattereri TaxID=42514 RepID=A0AAR2KXG7_PYGNA
MDATVKHLRIPPEMSVYAEKHEIFDLFQTLVRNLIIDKPADPIQYLIGMLKRESIEVPRIMLLGPPASGKRTIVSVDQGKAAESLFYDFQALDSFYQLVCTVCLFKILTVKWQIGVLQPVLYLQGWVLEAIPKTREEALCLQEAGIAPEHVVILQAPDAVLIERSLGKRIDPVTGDVYHVTFMWPESAEVAQRLERPQGLNSEDVISRQLQAYHSEAHALHRTYQSCLKIIDADQPHVDVFAQVLTYVMSRHRSAAPHTPRIILLGPPGSGKSLQARLIAKKYDIVSICCGELLKAVAADESSMGELIKPFLESGRRVPDSMVLQILTERLSRLDCVTRGWVLHGFPQDLEQAELLFSFRVFFLEMTDDVAVERLTLRAIDPVTGERYHSLYKPAPSPEVHARLRYNPCDSEAEVQRRLKEYCIHASALQAFYPQAVRVNADQDAHTVFECLESRLVNRLPKVLPDRA